MENILPYLPLVRGSSPNKCCCQWPRKAERLLRRLRFKSADDLLSAISSLRKALHLSSKPLPKSVANGFLHFFDKSMSSEESSKWFNKVLPTLVKLLLKLPSLLDSHFKDSNMDKTTTALRILEPQQPGLVFLSQELIAALLGCSLFCLFPVHGRHEKNLPIINFDKLFDFRDMLGYGFPDLENKIWCILHYFERISSDMPKGSVSFERRVYSSDANFWNNSAMPLCKFEAHSSGQIQDHSGKAVEVYFASKNFGGNALGSTSFEEERRFMFSPELIAGMLFLPAMKDDEAIEIVGVERFSTYAGYCSSFRYSDVYVDKSDLDTLGRRKTRIVVVNDLCTRGTKECTVDSLLSDINKSFCAFMNHGMDQGNNIGVAAQEWSLEEYYGIKPIVQWIAASQARRPFIVYCTHDVEDMQNLSELVFWISSRSWTVGFLYDVLIKYSTNRSERYSFFHWLQLTYGHTCRNLQEEVPFSACDICERERGSSRMENFLKYLPQLKSSFSLSWPPKMVKVLKKLEEGLLKSGEELFHIIRSPPLLSLPESDWDGFSTFFDNIMSKEESRKWFKEVVPALAKLLLNLPTLLEAHYKNADMDIFGEGATVTTALRILKPQTPGVVCLSQELIAALLGCSLFGLFPLFERSEEDLPSINFNKLFGYRILCNLQRQSQLNKIWCIVHYFQRICYDMPKGIVSFERKVLPLQNYPDCDFWSKSTKDLCKFKVHTSGIIEDQSSEAVEVYFADKKLGGEVLCTGTSREEIRFMLSPELLAGMLFLPAMEDNEAIEIVGAERFSTYAGFKSSFRYSGIHVDKMDVDTLGRQKTRVVVLEGLCTPTTKEFIIREINEAYCGFKHHGTDCDNNIGVATGDRVFGKDPEMKAIIKWLAASEAKRPFIAYCTFGLEALQNLDKVACWISSKGWKVGELWKKLIEYSTNGSKADGFFQWLQTSSKTNSSFQANPSSDTNSSSQANPSSDTNSSSQANPSSETVTKRKRSGGVSESKRFIGHSKKIK